jgi:hypothetical protein
MSRGNRSISIFLMIFQLGFTKAIQSFVFTVLLLSCCFHTVTAQSMDSIRSKSTIHTRQVDLRDLFRELFEMRHLIGQKKKLQDSTFVLQPLDHPALDADSVTITPGKLLFAVFPAVGYTIQTGTTAIVAMNLSFLNGKSDSTNLSTMAINPSMSLVNKQYLLNIISDIWSKNNKYDFLGDWRIYKYPTYTYGLGGHTSLNDARLIDYSYVRFYQDALKEIGSSKFYTGFGYNLDYHFSIKQTDEDASTDFSIYNGQTKTTVSSGLSFNALYDSRKNNNYPEDASFCNFAYRYNPTFMGSSQSWQSVYLEFKKYITLPGNSRNVLAFWNVNWFTFGGKPPYFDLPSTGWDVYSNTGRGYIQGRLRGPGMLYLESEYRFRLTSNGLLGGVMFLNAESVAEQGSKKFETVLPGTGFGLRVKLNKISGSNLSIDYGFGTEGSQGLFFNISEVF